MNFLYESVGDVGNESVVEVGAGDCEFAKEFCKLNSSVNYFAYDPSWREFESKKMDNIYLFTKYYDEKTLNNPKIVIARHVLEHQSDVRRFIKNLTFEKPKYLFIEIPCSSFVLNGQNYHYFSYEHCSYFDKDSLNKLMQDYNYYLIKQEYLFNNENLISLYIFNEKERKQLNNFKQKSYEISSFYKWKDLLKSKFSKNDIIWGVGGKGVMLLNLLDLSYQKMPKVIDINPKLDQKYIPITGNHIVKPSEINFENLDTVYVSNILYLEEIKKYY